MAPHVLTMVLAGGEGKRLAPLTLDRAKPAVPFGGNYRLIDFALSNLVNAGYRRIVVLTQYKSHSLDRHIAHDLGALAAARQLRHAGAGPDAPRPALVRRLGRRHLPELQPAQRRAARLRDRLRRRPHLPHGPAPDGRAAHRERRRRDGRRAARAARPGRPVRRDRDRRRTGAGSAAFREKPRDAVGLPDAPDQVFASMGNYVFTRGRAAQASSREDAQDETSKHDVGGNLIPMLVERGEAAGLRLHRQRGAGRDGARAGLLARRGDARRVLGGPHGPHLDRPRCSTSTTASGRSSPGTTRCRRPSSCSPTRTARATRWTRWCAPA